ncbi:hypothetical protein DVH24_040090 [Malus domestica]|uniref:DUF8040 domain-containing protein n=1 Tax=Malus domestica TaxID=3750 RepID=A0A498I5D7_MALDO|nr:hypothetical protein DVH24_040090 [Malus domestica]
MLNCNILWLLVADKRSINGRIRLRLLHYRCPLISLLLLVSEFFVYHMDRRKLLLILLLEMSHLETICICTILVLMMVRAKQRHVERPTLTNRSLVRREISLCYLNGIIGNTDIECVNELRMDRRTFAILCDLLRQDGRVKTDGLVSVEEQVCMTLQILAHHTKNRSVGGRFYRSGETINKRSINGRIRLRLLHYRCPLISLLLLVSEFFVYHMDRRKLLLILLLEMSHLETICICTILVLMMVRAKQRHVERPTLTNRSLVRREISLCYLNGIIGNTDIECVNELRMDRRTFAILCDLLRQDGRVKTDGLVSVEEQVCMTLQILAHHTKNRSVGGRFYRSGETINKRSINGRIRLRLLHYRCPLISLLVCNA